MHPQIQWTETAGYKYGGVYRSPSPAPLMDVNMLVLLPGRERTATEYGKLFPRQG